jgi:hypothetical protein
MGTGINKKNEFRIPDYKYPHYNVHRASCIAHRNYNYLFCQVLTLVCPAKTRTNNEMIVVKEGRVIIFLLMC